LALISDQVPNGHDSDPQGGHTAKYPTLTYSHETGFAELTPKQQDQMMKLLDVAEAVIAQERQDPWGRRPVAHSDGHLGPHDAAGAQTTTEGPFVKDQG
jgi:hypothetical protein